MTDHERTATHRRLCDPEPAVGWQRIPGVGETQMGQGWGYGPDAPTVADLADIPIWRYDSEAECEHGATYTGPAVVSLAGTVYGYGFDDNVTALSEPFTVTFCLVCHQLAPTWEDQL